MTSIISYSIKYLHEISNNSEVFWDGLAKKPFPVNILHGPIKSLRQWKIIKLILIMIYIQISILLFIVNGIIWIWSRVMPLTGRENVEEIIKTGPRGLRNTGSSCYMNAIIQALASSNAITEWFDRLQNIIGTECQRLKVLVNLLRAVNDPQSDVERNTKQLKLLMRLIHWDKQSQQDVYHLLTALISGIDEEVRGAFSQMEIPLRLKVVYKQSQLIGQFSIQNHIGLSIGLCGDYDKQPGVHLEYLIEQSLSPIGIDGDPSNTTQMFIYEKIPEILVLHIQANKWDSSRQEMVKPTYYIIYQEHLVLDLDICSADYKEIMRECDIRYGLTAVVHHLGSAWGGHYVTYRKHGTDWFLANDSSVEMVQFSNDICPYIMIYELAINPRGQHPVVDL